MSQQQCRVSSCQEDPLRLHKSLPFRRVACIYISIRLHRDFQVPMYLKKSTYIHTYIHTDKFMSMLLYLTLICMRRIITNILGIIKRQFWGLMCMWYTKALQFSRH
jgi:hypothetical protein